MMTPGGITVEYHQSVKLTSNACAIKVVIIARLVTTASAQLGTSRTAAQGGIARRCHMIEIKWRSYG